MATRKEQIVVETQPNPWILDVWCDDNLVLTIKDMQGVVTVEKLVSNSDNYRIWVDHRYSVAEVADEIRALAGELPK